jgi:DNA-binding beta-propeller fold protein YncE
MREDPMIRRRNHCLVVVPVIAGLTLAGCGRAGAPAGAPVATVHLGATSQPGAIGVNPVTNKVYVSELDAQDVIVIDGATNATTKVATGAAAGLSQKLAVSPATNKVYISQGARLQSSGVPGQFLPVLQESGDIAVIDGATNKTTSVHIGGAIRDLVADPANGKVYVTGSGPQLTVIDGTSDATRTMTVGPAFGPPVVNPVTHKVYLSTQDGLVVVDGVTSATATVYAGTVGSLALDPAANRIYVSGDATLTVLDATSYATIARVPVAKDDGVVAVNSKTHRIYLLNVNYPNPGSVTVVDGTTLATSKVSVGRSPTGLTIDESANAAYLVDVDSDDLVRIDGVTNRATAARVTHALPLLAVNPVTGRVYVVAGGPKAGPPAGPTNSPPPPYVVDVFDFRGASVPTVPVDTCYPSPQPGSKVPRGNC